VRGAELESNAVTTALKAALADVCAAFAAFSRASLARISDSFGCKLRCPLTMWWMAFVRGDEALGKKTRHFFAVRDVASDVVDGARSRQRGTLG
jgi:hypothetical protein